MTSSLTAAILGGLGGMLGWGFADFFAKKTIDRMGDLPSLVWAHVFGTAYFLLLALFNYVVTGHFIHLPSNFKTLVGFIFFGCLQMVVYWLVYKGFSKGQLAVLNPIFASYSGVVALISILFLSETLTGSVALGLIFLFAGILLMNLDIKGIRSTSVNILPGVKEVAAAAGLAAIWTILWDKFVSGQDFLEYALFMYLFMSLAAFIAARTQRVALLPVENDLWKYLVLIGLGEAVAYLCISYGFSRTTHTSVVALLSGAFSVPTVILARIYLKEKITRAQEISIVAIIFGIVIVALNS